MCDLTNCDQNRSGERVAATGKQQSKQQQRQQQTEHAVSAPPQDNVASEADVSEKEEKKEKECTTPKIR